jgi:hypothetical protein
MRRVFALATIRTAEEIACGGTVSSWTEYLYIHLSELLDFRAFLSSGILENRKHDVSETGSVSVLKWVENTYPVVTLRKELTSKNCG